MVSLDHIAPFAHATPAGRNAGGRWRFARPSLGLVLSVAMHAGAAGALLLLMRPVTEIAFGSAMQQVEVAVAFEAAKSPPPPPTTPVSDPLPILNLPPAPEPPPEPVKAEPLPRPPIEEPLPQQPEAPVQLVVKPPEPPKKVEEAPRVEPPKPVKRPVKKVSKPVPKPEPKAEPAPPTPAQSAPAPEPQQVAAAPTATTPGPTDASKPTAERAAVPMPDNGPDVVVNPEYRERPQPPIYPPRSILLGQQGRVIVRAAIDNEGVPDKVVVWESSGHSLLDTAAVTAVKRWRFMPARRAGIPVHAWVQVPVNFQLK